MFETATSMIGLPGAILAVWVMLIGALFFVTRGLSRSLAWTFVAGGFVIPVAVLHVWPPASTDACRDIVVTEGQSVDKRYAYRIVMKQCRTSSELAYRVEIGRKDPVTQKAALRPVMRSYGFPRPVAVSQYASNQFLIYWDGRNQRPLLISLDPRTGEPSYVHRFFQGHNSDRGFTVSELARDPAPASAHPSGRKKRCTKGKRHSDGGDLDATVTGPESASKRGSTGPRVRLYFRFALRSLVPGS